MSERTDFELIDALSVASQNYAKALYKRGEVIWSDVTFERAFEDRETAWADLEQRMNDLRRKMDEADSAAQADGWHPIETIEQCSDDMVMVALRNGEVTLFPMTSFRNPLRKEQVRQMHREVFEHDGTWPSASFLPTHWRPLPAPPAPINDGEK